MSAPLVCSSLPPPDPLAPPASGSRLRAHAPRAALGAVAAATLLALGACGGGGSSSDGASADQNPRGPEQAPAVTAENVEDQAALAYQAASSVYNSHLGGGLTGGASDGYVGAWPAVNVTLDRLQGMPFQNGLARARSAIAVTPFTTRTEPCTDGGSLTLALSDVDGDGVTSTGDSMRLDFAECSEDGVVTSGAIEVSGIGSTENAEGFTISGDYRLISVSSRALAAGTAPVVLDGDMRIQARYSTGAQPSIESTLSGSRLSSATSGRPTAVLTDYRATVIVVSGSDQYRYSFDGQVSDGEHAALTLTTPTPMVGQGGDHPSSGSLVATGADGSALRISARSSTTVEIGLDAQGDGQFEQTFTRSWSQLARSLNASPGVESDPGLKLD